jgi:hypothetical protein
MRHDVPTDEIMQAIQKGIHRQLEETALLGYSATVFENGRIVTLSPTEILERIRAAEQNPEQRNGC